MIVRESRTVFRLSDAAQDIPARIARAELISGHRLIATHHSAAELAGFGVLGSDLLHVTTAAARSVRAPSGVVVHQVALRSPVSTIGGVQCADPADTAVDLAAAVDPLDVLAVLDAALRAGLSPARLAAAVGRAQRMRGIREVRHQLTAATPLAESPMESRTRYRLWQAGLPEPELQILVPLRGGGCRRIDMGWRRARLGLEFDGQDFHSGDGSLDRDRHRNAELLAAGWTMVHITGRDVYQDPARFTDLLRELLGERGC